MYVRHEHTACSVIFVLASLGQTAVLAGPKWTLPMWLEEVPVMWQGSVFTRKSLYVGELYFGTPARKHTLIFDTGSGNTVLPQVGCESLGCLGKNLYNRSASSTSSVVDDSSLQKFRSGKIIIKYGDGELSGSFIQDRACLGVEHQCMMLNIVQAQRMSTNPFGLFSFDGVLGLGLGTLSASRNFSFVQQLMDHNPGMLGQLSIFLGSDGRDNSITLGGYDDKRALEKPKWASVIRPESGYWQVVVEAFSVSGIPFDYCDQLESVQNG